MDIQVVVATHKKYRMPKDAMYLPVLAGKKMHGNMPSSYQGDDTGDNISDKNKNYCELTTLYWAWKNLKADYIGLCHYRRHFRGSYNADKWESILTKQQLESVFKHTEVVLPKKRNYWIETNYSQYVHAHHEQDLKITEQILNEKYPDYIFAYEQVMKVTTGHRFNMFIMKRERLDAYCTWLFDVLFELEKRLDISGYTPYDARVFGFVAERLLDVWIIKNDVTYKEIPVMYMEKENWIKKGGNFLIRKYKGKYRGNFR